MKVNELERLRLQSRRSTIAAAPVLPRSVRSGSELEVLKPVVLSVPVDVVNRFANGKRSPEVPCHDKPMLGNFLSSSPENCRLGHDEQIIGAPNDDVAASVDVTKWPADLSLTQEPPNALDADAKPLSNLFFRLAARFVEINSLVLASAVERIPRFRGLLTRPSLDPVPGEYPGHDRGHRDSELFGECGRSNPVLVALDKARFLFGCERTSRPDLGSRRFQNLPNPGGSDFVKSRQVVDRISHLVALDNVPIAITGVLHAG